MGAISIFLFKEDSRNALKEKHCDKCPVREHESGKKIYFHNVLEAKLVMPNVLSISLATETKQKTKKYF
ncbi:MAG: hypothetical protein PVH88_10270 [Ignavibacteria bacterium]|jgi:hypothetical protein